MGGIVSSVADTLLSGIPTLSDDNKEVLINEVDDYTAFVVATIPPKLIGIEPIDDSAVRSEDVDLGWSKGFFDGEWNKDPPNSEDIVVANQYATLSIPLLSEDDFHGYAEIGALEVLRNPIILPLRDKFCTVSDEGAEQLLDELRLLPKEGQANPIPYHTWDEMSSDEAMSRIFFYGIGSCLMHNQSATYNQHQELGPFVVDMDLCNYQVRPGFARYGSRLHFDAEQNITAIFDYGSEKLIKPGEGQAWEKAKYVAKQTTITLVTVREHLLWTHVLLSNTMTRVKTQELPPGHPLRRLLTVFTFRTNYVNNSATAALVSISFPCFFHAI